MTTTEAPVLPAQVAVAVEGFVRFLETGSAPARLFAPDAFIDLTLPWWRVQAEGVAGVVALRTESHPYVGKVTVGRVDATVRGFVMEFEERWQDGGQHWYCREMLRADLREGQVVGLSVYCTGDWDEARQRQHREKVRLLRN